ncbi:MAG: response regulator, partial [Myxococcota bacterium]|nr:response regulator [Myxococcota bacterium]
MLDEDLVQLLIIEDNREYSFLIREYIEVARPGLFEVESVERLAAGLERLMRGSVDLVLLDLTLPDSHGMETFLAVHACAPEVPVVVLTGHDDERTAREAAQEGAQDYLVKGEVSGDLLVRCMLSAIERHQVREKLKRYAHALEASEARFRGVIESSSDGVAIVDREGRLRFLNRSAEVMLGRRAADMLDRLFGVPAREDQSMEIDVLRPDSEPAVALRRAVDTRWDGEPASMLTLRDVTGRERLRALETQLEEEGQLIRHLRELDRMK